jgi:hypothetical protein
VRGWELLATALQVILCLCHHVWKPWTVQISCNHRWPNPGTSPCAFPSMPHQSPAETNEQKAHPFGWYMLRSRTPIQYLVRTIRTNWWYSKFKLFQDWWCSLHQNQAHRKLLRSFAQSRQHAPSRRSRRQLAWFLPTADGQPYSGSEQNQIHIKLNRSVKIELESMAWSRKVSTLAACRLPASLSSWFIRPCWNLKSALTTHTIAYCRGRIYIQVVDAIIISS